LPGIYRVEARTHAGSTEKAWLGARVDADAGALTAAEWTVFLLNRPDGWLARALEAPGLARDARATVLGGTGAAAIVVELTADAATLDQATMQLRALMSRLGAGAITDVERQAAQAHFAGIRRTASLDPRRRVLDTWLGTPPWVEPGLDQLRHFHAATFAEDRHVVVTARPRR
jgi:hypothetical protein